MSRRDRATRVVTSVAELPRAFEVALSVEDPAEDAYVRGQRDGAERAAAESEARYGASLAEIRAELATALAAVAGLRARLTQDHEQAMIDLALEAASVIVRERIATDDPIAARAVQEALDAVPSGDDMTVRLHPDDLAGVQTLLADAVAQDRLTLEPDDGVSRGGCVVSTANGTIDARLETATAAVAEAANGGGDAP